MLSQLRHLADAQKPSNNNTSAGKPIRVVAFPSQGRSSGSPLLRSDEEVRQGSPKSRARPFWGPGLPQPDSPTTSASSAVANPSSNPSGREWGSRPSMLTRLHQLYTGERNLTTSNNRANAGADVDSEASSSSGTGSSKLWHFDVSMSQDVLRSMFYKRLCWRLGACPEKLSLIAEALQASSTGVQSLKTLSVVATFLACGVISNKAVPVRPLLVTLQSLCPAAKLS